VKRLADAPVSEWRGILVEPDSANQRQDLKGLIGTCNLKGFDTSDTLLHSSLRAVRKESANARFLTLSGDLIAHNFPCKYQTLVPGKTAEDYAAFVEKTIAYVMDELRRSEPGVAVYASLGNNDSGCNDYRMDPNSDFLKAVGESMLAGLPQSDEKRQALEDFAVGGYYSVTMARPMQRTRLIVVNDMFMARNYRTCSGKVDTSAGTAQIEWLDKQLDEARRRGQRVWVMGHIPPGVDVYGTLKKGENVCKGATAETYLTESLTDAMVKYADVERLGIFAHTHMDELRLMGPEGDGVKATAKEMVPVKMVSSISPVHGNRPAFTVAWVDPRTARLEDYEVFIASNLTGVDATWSKEYRFSEVYHKREFAPKELEQMLAGFRADPMAKGTESQAFIRYFFAGDDSGLIKPVWPQYVCALSSDTTHGFEECVCPVH
jgi:sphingomyelin phosphodiesterase acid-like 3